jgi:hypothetical protein
MSIFSSLLNKFKGKNSEAAPIEEDAFYDEYDSDYEEADNDLHIQTMNQLYGEHTDDDYEKHNELLKKSTALKKEGNLDGAISTIDEALNLYRNREATYKKANYQYINKQCDDGWKTITNFHQDVGELFLKADDWKSVWHLFSIYAATEEDLVKLLKKEKKVKDISYWLPGSIYAQLIQQTSIGFYKSGKIENMIDMYSQKKLSDFIKKPLPEFNMEAYDKAYSDYVLSTKSNLLNFNNIARELEEFYLDRDDINEWLSLQKSATKALKSQRMGILKINKLCNQAINS